MTICKRMGVNASTGENVLPAGMTKLSGGVNRQCGGFRHRGRAARPGIEGLARGTFIANSVPRGQTVMLELIKACYEIRALRGRLGLGLELDPADEAALTVLERLFGPPGGVGVARRLETRVPVLFKSIPGRMVSGKLTDLSADGAFVETDVPLGPG